MATWRMAGRLTTHVLDTASGKPAAGLSIALYPHRGRSRRHAEDGRDQRRRALRCAAARRARNSAPANTSWSFSAGDYLRGAGGKAAGAGISRHGADPLRHGRARRIIMCRCWSRPTAIRPTGGAEPWPSRRSATKCASSSTARTLRLADVAPDETLLDFLRLDAFAARHQGRLRRGRLRRLHRAGRPAVGRQAGL